ncbi:hypothetical protein BDW62DRAFT_197106 [Aspergillus aurantiobrunneus]
MKATAETAFALSGISTRNACHILVGQRLDIQPDAGIHDKETPLESWALRSGLYTPRQLVEGFAPLLDTIVFRLGPDPPGSKPARVQLLDNLASNLDTSTREATLCFPATELGDSRREMAEQAKHIGRKLVEYARNHTDGPFNPDLYLRSPCEGHLLLPPNADLMFGRRSQSHLMQLFNEYMHQMVLLRDALLPFNNYEDVIIPIDGRASRGIRHLESSRSEFLTQLLTKEATQAAIVKQAQALLAPGLHSVTSPGAVKTSLGYGFQYAHGLVLPAFLTGGQTPLHLLQYIPAKLVDNPKGTIFDYRIQDYYLAPRIEISAPATKKLYAYQVEGYTEATTGWGALVPSAQSACIGVTRPSSGSIPSSQPVQHLELQLQLDNGKCISVDLGQIARGHRYAYQVPKPSDSAVFSADDEDTTPAMVYDVASVLETGTSDSLVSTVKNGLHVIRVQESIVALAVLGKIYPGNVVLLPASDGLALASQAGKGLGPKFVLWGGVDRGGLRGKF